MELCSLPGSCSGIDAFDDRIERALTEAALLAYGAPPGQLSANAMGYHDSAGWPVRNPGELATDATGRRVFEASIWAGHQQRGVA